MAPLIGLVVRGEEQSVPLKEISVQSFIKGSLVGFRSKLCYENDTNKLLEVVFRTPVDDTHAVVGLEAIIDGRRVKASLQEKEKAREMYKEAIRKGRSAAFAEEKKGDIFSIVLGNLPQNSKAEINLTMVGELAVEPDGSIRMVLPTVLKPRYTPIGGDDPLKATPGFSVRHALGPSVFKFNLVITDASKIAMVTSPTHDLETVTHGDIINVNVKEACPKDIVILVKPQDPHQPKVIIEPGIQDGENDYQKSTALMFSFLPALTGNESNIEAACEFIFLIDRSGSMRGPYIRDASKTLLLFLKSLPEGCYFNIVGFGSSYVKLFPESVIYNQKTLDKAVSHAENLQADLGGTELFDPLNDILQLAQMKGLPRQVFLLTDGSVSNTESVIKLVSRHAHNARCFSFGIGSGASTTLVNGIAEASHGAADFIVEEENMLPKVIRALKKAMQPAIIESTVEFNLPPDYIVQVAPKNVPVLFLSETTRIYATVKCPDSKNQNCVEGSVCLSGKYLGAKIEHKLHFQIPPSSSVTKATEQVATIHHLAAKALIKEMRNKDAVDEKELLKISLDANVICHLTGFIAIDENQKAPEGGLETWDIMAHESYDMASRGSLFHCLGRPSLSLARKARPSKAMSYDSCDNYTDGPPSRPPLCGLPIRRCVASAIKSALIKAAPPPPLALNSWSPRLSKMSSLCAPEISMRGKKSCAMSISSDSDEDEHVDEDGDEDKDELGFPDDDCFELFGVPDENRKALEGGLETWDTMAHESYNMIPSKLSAPVYAVVHPKTSRHTKRDEDYVAPTYACLEPPSPPRLAHHEEYEKHGIPTECGIRICDDDVRMSGSPSPPPLAQKMRSYEAPPSVSHCDLSISSDSDDEEDEKDGNLVECSIPIRHDNVRMSGSPSPPRLAQTMRSYEAPPSVSHCDLSISSDRDYCCEPVDREYAAQPRPANVGISDGSGPSTPVPMKLGAPKQRRVAAFLSLFKKKSKTSKKGAPPPTPPIDADESNKNTVSISDLQRANGSWKLSDNLAKVFGKTVKLLKSGCPVACEGDMVDIWATVLALSHLEHKEKDCRNEWELLAKKADLWLSKQTLPEKCTLEMLKKAAVALI